MATFFSDWYYLSIRSTKQIWRPVMALIPSLFIPVFFFLVNSSSLSSFSQVKGFPPGVTYRDFVAPIALFTAVFFSAGNAGIELVQDISSGYFKKLLIMPISKLTIILGRLSEIAVQAVMQGAIVLVLLLLVGVRFQTGFLGVLAIFALLVIFAMAWGCVSMIFALRTQNQRLVQSMFILVFPFLYLTTSQAPMGLLPRWFQLVATYNPVTYIIEGVRSLTLYDWSAPAIWQGFLVATILWVVLVSLALASFKKTLK
ncbi:MAG TPA: ABC transporter permease [Fimbriimonadaceae bacterium]|nr:ABC transporter permease [Fimbriimonadaceae bacterium]